MLDINLNTLPSPCYLIDERKLIKNLEILKKVRERAGCSILLAQKAFSMFSVYPLIAEYLDGTAASGLFEARLGYEEMRRGGACAQTHVYSPAYSPADFAQIITFCDYIIFNNISQLNRFYPVTETANRDINIGIRINPEYSEIETEIYNPCAKNSRLGCTVKELPSELPQSVTGLHFHAMCEQGADVLERIIEKAEDKFGKYFHNIKWLNLGGGHHITKDGYDIEKLVSIVTRLREKYGVRVYLEPGEAVALNAGYLVTEVLDTIERGGGQRSGGQNSGMSSVGEVSINLAITDASAACHMPDVLEMPYRPEIIGAGKPGEKAYTYRLGGPTCLAGDIIGDYSFDKPLKPGGRLVLCDMAIYTMVKNNTFNGINLPSILLLKSDGAIKTIRSFGYEDFKSRL